MSQGGVRGLERKMTKGGGGKKCYFASDVLFELPLIRFFRQMNVSHLHLSTQSQIYCKITVLTLSN